MGSGETLGGASVLRSFGPGGHRDAESVFETLRPIERGTSLPGGPTRDHAGTGAELLFEPLASHAPFLQCGDEQRRAARGELRSHGTDLTCVRAVCQLADKRPLDESPCTRADSATMPGKTLADRLTAALKFRGMTVYALELAAELGRGHGDRLKSGATKKPTPEVIGRIAKALRVSYAWLAAGEGEMLDGIEEPGRYAAIPAVRAMALASGFPADVVNEWEVALKLDREPTPDELWKLFKAAHKKGPTPPSGPSDLDDARPVRKRK